MSKELTEQWQKGELPEGHCYVKDGDNMIAEYLDGYFYNNGEPMTSFSGGIDEVLAPVPSYDEWKDTIERYHLCIEANQSLRKRLDEEKAKNRIDYYDGSPMDYLNECERARRKNKILENWIKNIRKEVIEADLRKTKEGNRFVVELLTKINEALK